MIYIDLVLCMYICMYVCIWPNYYYMDTCMQGSSTCICNHRCMLGSSGRGEGSSAKFVLGTWVLVLYSRHTYVHTYVHTYDTYVHTYKDR